MENGSIGLRSIMGSSRDLEVLTIGSKNTMGFSRVRHKDLNT